MAVRLPARTLDLLRPAQQALLSPFEFPDARSWCLEVVRRSKALVDADCGFMILAPTGKPAFQTEDFDEKVFHALGASEVSAGMVHVRPDDIMAAQAFALKHNVQAWDARTLTERLTRRPYEESASFREFTSSVHVVDALSVQVALPTGAAIIALGRTSRFESIAHVREKVQSGQLLGPALRSGVMLYSRLAAWRERLPAVLDQLEVPAMICTLSGSEICRSELLEALLATAPDREQIIREIQWTAREVGWLVLRLRGQSPVVPSIGFRRITGKATRYAVRCALLAEGMFALDSTVLVAVEDDATVLPGPRQLQALGLTARESEIADLLARGASNKAVARSLGIRPSTVRTHAEHLFAKLGIRSRKGLGLLLLDKTRLNDRSRPPPVPGPFHEQPPMPPQP